MSTNPLTNVDVQSGDVEQSCSDGLDDEVVDGDLESGADIFLPQPRDGVYVGGGRAVAVRGSLFRLAQPLSDHLHKK